MFFGTKKEITMYALERRFVLSDISGSRPQRDLLRGADLLFFHAGENIFRKCFLRGSATAILGKEWRSDPFLTCVENSAALAQLKLRNDS
jgi:hypothetical protein